jgi:hypothetical protein
LQSGSGRGFPGRFTEEIKNNFDTILTEESRFAINPGRHYKERPITIMNVELL